MTDRTSPRRPHRARWAIALAAALALPAAASAAPAEPGPADAKAAAEPQVRTAKQYEDWTIGCEQAVTGKGEVCFAYQKLSPPGSSQVLANIAIGYPGPGKPPVAILNLPLGMLLPVGVALQVDDTNPPVRLQGPVKVCYQEGCRAEVPFDGKVVQAFRQKATAHLAFMDMQERLVELPISLKGFTKAFESLKH